MIQLTKLGFIQYGIMFEGLIDIVLCYSNYYEYD